ncbi:hypothetical protein EXS71_02810 [Candidatus Uhrbacteria bacterium]|nr:hypothetical protein [Candidatus Uhrbacteria bacterium]
MHTLSRSLALALIITTTAQAERPKASLHVGSAIIFPMSFTGKSLTPSTLLSVIGLVPVSERWGLIFKGGMISSLSTFQPAPQLQLGASVKLASRFVLGATGIYRYVPHWSGTPSDWHLIGGSLAPTVPLPSKIALAFPIGVAHNLTTHDSSFSIAFELVFQLPL